jgi:hypothetical protein
MRRWRRALVGAFLLAALAPAPASAAAPVVFEGRVAEATWTHCDDTGCIETTAYLSVGTATFPDKSVTDVNSLCVQAAPSPQPSVATVITGCIPGVGTVAADLSSAAGSGVAFVYSQDCNLEGVCHPGSTEPIGDETVSVTWAATGPAVRHASTSVTHLTRITFEECTYISVQTGIRREATAELTWDAREVGELTSAWISEVTTRSVRACHMPF